MSYGMSFYSLLMISDISKHILDDVYDAVMTYGDIQKERVRLLAKEKMKYQNLPMNTKSVYYKKQFKEKPWRRWLHNLVRT